MIELRQDEIPVLPFPLLLQIGVIQGGCWSSGDQEVNTVQVSILPDLLVVYRIRQFEGSFRSVRMLHHQYSYVLITDGQPDIDPSERRNIDKKTDKYTRRDYYNNGFYLELPPFNLDLTVVCEHQLPSGELIRTALLENPSKLGR